MLLEWRAAAAPCLCSFPGELRGALLGARPNPASPSGSGGAVRREEHRAGGYEARSATEGMALAWLFPVAGAVVIDLC